MIWTGEELAEGQVDLHGDEIFCAEPEIHFAKFGEAAEHQTRAGEQEKCQGDFGNYEDASHVRAMTREHGALALLERLEEERNLGSMEAGRDAHKERTRES